MFNSLLSKVTMVLSKTCHIFATCLYILWHYHVIARITRQPRLHQRSLHTMLHHCVEASSRQLDIPRVNPT